MVGVRTLVGNLEVQTLNLPHRPFPAIASLLLSGQFPLQSPKPLQTAMQILGVRKPLTVAGGDQRLNPEIDTDRLVCFRILRSRNVVAREASVPLNGPILDGKGI